MLNNLSSRRNPFQEPLSVTLVTLVLDNLVMELNISTQSHPYLPLLELSTESALASLVVMGARLTNRILW